VVLPATSIRLNRTIQPVRHCPDLFYWSALSTRRISSGVNMDFLQFTDDGRTLTCRSASSPATPGTTWWWLEVTGESQRYAAFRTEPTDTPENLRPRIVAHYANLLAERARPAVFRPRWGGRPKTAAPAPADPAT
jgi:hypothetical protein